MRVFSKATAYAIRALVEIARDPSAGRLNARDLCERSSVPEPFARKALQALARNGILRGSRGPGGGYTLLAPPSHISLYAVVVAIDGQEILNECPMGRQTLGEGERHPACVLPLDDEGGACPLHDHWQDLRRAVVETLRGTTLADLIGDPMAAPEPLQAGAAS